ncbi:histidinol dehydrogenase [Amycolatopsis minnesotensis]|uniref:Histidinol dehydrogenase n=1 Tax=Amycolatopsis minnesotensis TaxID=337894 RepID=A0ABP5DH23_9PSEU
MAEYLKQGWRHDAARSEEVVKTVSRILHDVETEGLPAIRRYSEQLDNWNPESFVVSADEIAKAREAVPDELGRELEFALGQVRNFAAKQRETLTDLEVETLPGVVLGHRHIPVDAVGSYSPGGRYPLIASSIMTVAVPKTAGVRTVVAAAPPREAAGIYPPQLYTMDLAGADVILCLGGVQAFAALAFGVEDVKGVDMVVGAGNAFVAEAKRQLFGTVGIDLLAGPTEVAVIADETADPRLVAADLLGQAEHGPNSPALLVTTSRPFGQAVLSEVDRWLAGQWPTKEVAGAAWREHGAVVVADSLEEAAAISDSYAPEHLEVQTADDDWYFEHLRNYGSLFVGPESTVAYSDKSIGTNHVLPTGRAARYTGGLWVGKFLKTVTYQRLTPEGGALVAPSTAAIADAELMFGHALTARLRLEERTGSTPR